MDIVEAFFFKTAFKNKRSPIGFHRIFKYIILGKLQGTILVRTDSTIFPQTDPLYHCTFLILQIFRSVGYLTSYGISQIIDHTSRYQSL
jgi:hypothetical protein